MQNIRDYRDSDFETIKMCLEEGELYESICDTPEAFQRMIQRQPGSIIVAEVDHEPVGVLFLSYDGRCASIDTFAIRTSHRGNGIGSAMVDEADKRLRSWGVKEYTVAADPADDKVNRFYRAHGFEPTDPHKLNTYYKDV